MGISDTEFNGKRIDRKYEKKIYASMQSVIFSAAIFMKIVNTQRSCEEIYTLNFTQIDIQRRGLRAEINLRP